MDKECLGSVCARAGLGAFCIAGIAFCHFPWIYGSCIHSTVVVGIFCFFITTYIRPVIVAVSSSLRTWQMTKSSCPPLRRTVANCLPCVAAASVPSMTTLLSISLDSIVNIVVGENLS